MLGAALDEYQINCRFSPVRVMYTIPSADRTALSLLLENARRKQFESGLNKPRSSSKTSSKSAAIAGVLAMRAAQTAWYVDVDEAKRDDEIAYLGKFIYLRDVDGPNLRVSLLKADLKIINHPRWSALIYQTA